jgi:Skp family chaperone for outer membrane proteins
VKQMIMISCSLALATFIGCSSAYYKTMETFGYHKRDILVNRVADARDSQKAAKEQFKSALERFNELLGTTGGSLQVKYDKLNSEYEKSKTRADTVRKRIADVEEVSAALFKEWKNELAQYTNKEYRAKDEQLLSDTKSRYEQLISAMKRAEAKMDPVLAAFQDRVIFLKHNLNAQAIASLQGERQGNGGLDTRS